jgi:hypothetical protein
MAVNWMADTNRFDLNRLTLAVFVVLQVADGLITYEAVKIFGTAAEGNQLLAVWMGLLGLGPALLGAKLLACGCAGVLHVYGVRSALFGLTVFYAVAAVVPWLRSLAMFLPA